MRAATTEFGRLGFDGATTAGIARKADVTEAQIFRYFATKADLFRAAVFDPLDAHLRDFLAASNTTDPAAVEIESRHYITELQDFLAQNANLWLSLLAAGTHRPEGVRNVAQIGNLQTYFEHGAATMQRRLRRTPKVPPELMVRVSFAGVLGCVLLKDWIFPPGIAREADIRSAINEFVMNGINANASAADQRKSGKHR